MALHDPKPTLVMGAGGSIGTFVLQGLIAQGLPVRASARKPDPARSPRGVDVVAADLTDPSSLARAFAGAGQVFLYANHAGVQGVIGAARTAGVETIILLSSGSVIHPTSVGNAITEEHRAVEEAFAAATDLTVVPIRPLVLATNALAWSWSIRAGEALPLYRPDAVTAPIHERDIAAVAVAGLTRTAHTGAASHDTPSHGTGPSPVTGLLTGPARISQRDQVAAISAATGTTIRVDELGRDGALARFSRFMPAGDAEAVVQFLDDAAAGNSPATTTVADVLGRPPIDFAGWAADHVDDFR